VLVSISNSLVYNTVYILLYDRQAARHFFEVKIARIVPVNDKELSDTYEKRI
jgi:hypothetical protein